MDLTILPVSDPLSIRPPHPDRFQAIERIQSPYGVKMSSGRPAATTYTVELA